ncbi:MAG: XkdF-like putative serine protease domain-containing protein [Acetobacteraceae bacterium]|nr:XkdF-like putative serine protease domain-containing protein [Acetobacteraceae bacterium]
MPKLTDLDVEFISLVKRPANGRRIVLRGADARGREFALTRADARLRRVYGIVYAPDSVDSQGDWADAQTIRRAADRFMLHGRAPNVDREHDFNPAPAFVAESWLTRTGDPLFPHEREGAWAVGIQITDAALWDAIEAGEVEGLSLAGTARLEKWMGWLVRGKERHMTPEEVRAIVKQTIEETVKDAERAQAEQEFKQALARQQAQTEQLAAALAKAQEAVEALRAQLEAAHKRQPAAPAPEGEPKPEAAASFV